MEDLKKKRIKKFREKLAEAMTYMTEAQAKGVSGKDFADEIVKKRDAVIALFQETIDEAYREKITGDTSDGYHTFNELYEFRKIYNAVLFNEWALTHTYDVYKSKKHHDGEDCFGGGWFIVMATLPTGQISNHYELKDWDLFKCEERERAEEWDGHTAQDVVKRLLALIIQDKKEDSSE